MNIEKARDLIEMFAKEENAKDSSATVNQEKVVDQPKEMKEFNEINKVQDQPIESDFSTLQQFLGLQDGVNLHSEEIELTDDEQVIIESVVDTTGYLSNVIKSVEKKYGNSVNPLELCCVLSNIKSLKEFDIIEIDGKPYASGNNHVVNQERLETISDEIKNQLSAGTPYKRNLICKGCIGDKTFTTVELNNYEIRKLCTRFRSEHAKKIVSSTGGIWLVVGIK